MREHKPHDKHLSSYFRCQSVHLSIGLLFAILHPRSDSDTLKTSSPDEHFNVCSKQSDLLSLTPFEIILSIETEPFPILQGVLARYAAPLTRLSLIPVHRQEEVPSLRSLFICTGIKR